MQAFDQKVLGDLRSALIRVNFRVGFALVIFDQKVRKNFIKIFAIFRMCGELFKFLAKNWVKN